MQDLQLPPRRKTNKHHRKIKIHSRERKPQDTDAAGDNDRVADGFEVGRDDECGAPSWAIIGPSESRVGPDRSRGEEIAPHRVSLMRPMGLHKGNQVPPVEFVGQHGALFLRSRIMGVNEPPNTPVQQ